MGKGRQGERRNDLGWGREFVDAKGRWRCGESEKKVQWRIKERVIVNGGEADGSCNEKWCGKVLSVNGKVQERAMGVCIEGRFELQNKESWAIAAIPQLESACLKLEVHVKV